MEVRVPPSELKICGVRWPQDHHLKPVSNDRPRGPDRSRAIPDLKRQHELGSTTVSGSAATERSPGSTRHIGSEAPLPRAECYGPLLRTRPAHDTSPVRWHVEPSRVSGLRRALGSASCVKRHLGPYSGRPASVDYPCVGRRSSESRAMTSTIKTTSTNHAPVHTPRGPSIGSTSHQSYD